MAEKLLSNVLEAEDARLSRCFDATQLVFVRTGFMKTVRLKRLLGEWLASCDSVCALNREWLAIVLPGLDEGSGLDVAEGLVEAFEGRQPVALCSLPHLRLRQMGTDRLLDLVRQELSANLKGKKPIGDRQKGSLRGGAAASDRDDPDPLEDGDAWFGHPLVLDIAGGVPEDEARVSVEEKNFLFA